MIGEGWLDRSKDGVKYARRDPRTLELLALLGIRSDESLLRTLGRDGEHPIPRSADSVPRDGAKESLCCRVLLAEVEYALPPSLRSG